MKPALTRLLLATLVFMVADPLFAPFIVAPIWGVDQFKTTVYSQTSVAPPTTPNSPDSYYFGAYVLIDTSLDVTNAVVNSPGSGVLALPYVDPIITNKLYNSTPYYADESSFDIDFPGGTYDYNYDYTDPFNNVINADITFDISTDNLYADAIPAFTTNCWNGMRQVDPAQDFQLEWNSYDLTPGADFAATFVNIFDPGSGYSLPGFTGTPDFTTTNIPAGSLQYGRTYEVDLYFSERQLPSGPPGISIIAGWDNLTAATLTTIAPWLTIARAGKDVVLNWPALASSNYQLQTTTTLSPTNSWSGVPNVPVLVGTTNTLALPATNSTAFFRLAPQAP